MHVTREHHEIIKKILEEHVPEYDVWAFGSRVHSQRLKKFSDLDLVIIDQQPLPPKRVALLKEAFSASDLPFFVDIVEWSGLAETFKKAIKHHYEVVITKSV